MSGEEVGERRLRGQGIWEEHQLSSRPHGTKTAGEKQSPLEGLQGKHCPQEIWARRLRLGGIWLMADQELQRYSQRGSGVGKRKEVGREYQVCRTCRSYRVGDERSVVLTTLYLT